MAVGVVKMVQVRVVHRVQVAHLDVLVEVADVGQLLLADVALINDVVGSRGRWQDRNRSGLSVLSVLLLMRQDVLLQVRLLRVGLQADVASVWTNSLRKASERKLEILVLGVGDGGSRLKIDFEERGGWRVGGRLSASF